MTNPVVSDLIARSNRLGADPRNTNYAGGNTSAKGTETDPVTGPPVELLWVKGSGGDLGTLTEAGPRRPPAGPAALAGRRLPGRRPRGRDGRRLRLLPARPRRRRAVDRHRDARAGATPRTSTTCTPTRASRWPPRPTARRSPASASATASSGCRGAGRASSSAWTSPPIEEKNPQAIGCILGGHGVTAWGATSEECEANSLEIIRTAERFLAERGKAEPFGAAVPGLRGAGRRRAPDQGRRPGAGHPRAWRPPTSRRSGTSPTPTSSSSSWRRPSTRGWRRWAPPAPTTSCAPRCGRWSSTCRPPPRSRTSSRGWRSCTRSTAPSTPPTTSGTRRRTSPPMRGADPAIVLVPGVGMFSFGANKQTARVAGEFYVNAINVMRGAEAVSTYAPIDESEKFRIEYWALEEAKLAADAEAQAAGHPGRAGHRRGERASARRSRGGWPPRGPASSSPTWTWRRRTDAAAEIGTADVAIGVAADVSDAEAVGRGLPRGGAGLRRGGPGGQQRRAVDLQAAAGDHRARLGPAARRHGQGQLPGLPRGGPDHDRAGPRRRHRLHLQQELAVRRPEQHRLRRDQGRPGPPGAAAGRRARPAPDPGQRHQPRRRRPRLGHLRRRLGRLARRRLRRRGGRSSASSTPSAPCSSARCCPSTSPTPSSR